LENELPPSAGAAAVLWPMPPRTKRGPKPRFSIDGITEAALVIADRDGLAAVTMQSVAEALGTTKMALYRHVPGRTELDALLLDRAIGTCPPLRGEDWRSALDDWASHLHARARQHPWTVELAQRPHLPGPHELGWFEAGLAATTALPLSGGERLDALVLLTGHVFSLMRQESMPHPEATLAAGIADILTVRSEDFPHTAAAFADTSTRDDALRFGLDRILDGIGALVSRRS